MYTVVGIRFKKAGKVYYFDPNDISVTAGDNVIVETARGMEYGEVVIGPKGVSEKEVVLPLKSVVRKATKKDMQQVNSNSSKEAEAFEVCLGKIEKHQLPMKLVDVEYSYDVSKIIFYFTAEGRVDFRELVKDLASIFRTRIELRQIGVRDESCPYHQATLVTLVQ
jgi:cell fate regulator YaaT (PSP1 superfamily)